MHWGLKMMDNNKDKDVRLESLFQDARATPPQMPDGLMARVLADAVALQPVAEKSGWRGWLTGIGGLPALGGLLTASCLGFWIGVAPPAGVPDLAGQVLGVEAALDEDLDGAGLTGFGWDIGEG